MKHEPTSMDELIEFIAHQARRLREATWQPSPEGEAAAVPPRRARRRRHGWRAARMVCRTRSPRSPLVH